MVIGNGLMAKIFCSYNDNCEYLIFASGVSDSSSTEKAHFEREELLLRESLKIHASKIFVYFSSCDAGCIYTKNNLYYQHKRNVESIIKSNSRKFHIFRLPQVVGKGGNSKSLINFFILNISKHREFDLFKGAYKNILDVDDVLTLCNYIMKHKLYRNTTVNIVNSNYFKVEDIVKKIEKFLDKKAMFKRVKARASCEYDDHIQNEITSKANVAFDENYIDKLLIKYYREYSGA